MFYNDDFRQDENYGYGDGIDININNSNMNSNQYMTNNDMDMGYTMPGCPIIEAGRERLVQRNIVHEVRQE